MSKRWRSFWAKIALLTIALFLLGAAAGAFMDAVHRI